ncbi:CpaF family protein [Streptomyces sp. NPDC006285]|uniref:CpaF family protein n=1 Tax=Streptomyces sp. NPDC006285 TaxID=3364742 RepID=UPI00369419F1
MADSPSRTGANGQSPGPMGREALAHLLAGKLGEQRPAQPMSAAPPGPGTSGGVGAAAVPKLAGVPAAVLPVGWEVIEALQGEVSAKLTARDPERTLAEPDRRALARSLVHTAVADWATTYAQGNTPVSSEDEVRIATAVYDAMFRGGRLQSLLDEAGVEDVMVDGLTAHVEYFDKPRRTIDKVADSHDELITWVNRMARQSGQGERALTQATPMVGFRMPDGSRVTASVLTSRPSVVIRKHRIVQHGMGDLVQWQSINPLLERFLVACVQARMNLLVVGDMGAGKTSLLRALGREIPASERVVTLESDRELYLDEPGPRPGPLTFAFEARQSNGERAVGDRLAGEVTISDMFATALRYNATRVIVGEVRSTEIVPMLQAMSAGGSGSMCTLHVRRPHAVISRLAQLCTEAGLPGEAAYHLIASAIDVVVYLAYLDETALGGRRHRFVSHIYEIDDIVGEAGRPTLTELFAPVPGEPRAVYRHMPSFIDALELTGLVHRSWLAKDPHSWWGAALQLEGRRP